MADKGWAEEALRRIHDILDRSVGIRTVEERTAADLVQAVRDLHARYTSLVSKHADAMLTKGALEGQVDALQSRLQSQIDTNEDKRRSISDLLEENRTLRSRVATLSYKNRELEQKVQQGAIRRDR